MDEVGICVRCGRNPCKVFDISDDWYCNTCIRKMAILYLKREYKDEKIIMEAQDIIRENSKKK